MRLVDGVARRDSAGARPTCPIAWESNHFVKGQDGITYLPFTLTIDRSKLAKGDVAFYVRVVDKTRRRLRRSRRQPPKAQGATPRPRRRRVPCIRGTTSRSSRSRPNGKLSRAIALKAGEYEAFIAIKEKGTEKPEERPALRRSGLLRQELTIPDFTVAELATSSILVASAIEVLNAPLAPAQQEDNPYTFGPMKIGLSPDGKFSKSGELNLVFWIYGAGAAAGGKPDVQIDYAFHQKLAEGEKYFNRTQPQVLNAQSLPPEFDVAAGPSAAGHADRAVGQLPVGRLSAGDQGHGQDVEQDVVTQNVTFTVLPA